MRTEPLILTLVLILFIFAIGTAWTLIILFNS